MLYRKNWNLVGFGAGFSSRCLRRCFLQNLQSGALFGRRGKCALVLATIIFNDYIYGANYIATCIIILVWWIFTSWIFTSNLTPQKIEYARWWSNLAICLFDTMFLYPTNWQKRPTFESCWVYFIGDCLKTGILLFC